MAAAINSLSLLRNPVRAMVLRTTLNTSRGSVCLSSFPSPSVMTPTTATSSKLCSRFSSRRIVRTICHVSSPRDEETVARKAAVNADTGAPTIFDKIISKEIPSTIVYEDEMVLAFRDINPQAPVHVVVIPKLRDGLTELGKAEERHCEILGRLLYAAKLVAKKEGIEDGFRVVINSGPDACKISYSPFGHLTLSPPSSENPHLDLNHFENFLMIFYVVNVFFGFYICALTLGHSETTSRLWSGYGCVHLDPPDPALAGYTGLMLLLLLLTLYMLYKEYETITTMRLRFISQAERRPDRFTVLVRNVPQDPDESVSEHVEHFFCVNHPDQYLLHQVLYNANKLASLVDKMKSMHNWLTYYQNKYERNPGKKPMIKTGLCGLWGARVDAIDYYTEEIEKLTEQEAAEREVVLRDPKNLLPAAFVSFKSRWGAAVCAQTQQSSNPTIWLTEWAPEPRDVYWNNLTIPYVELNIRRLLMAVAFFLLTFFFMIPIAFVQSLANIDGIQKTFPFLKNILKSNGAKSFIQGFLPGMILKIFLILVPMILMIMSKIEGFTSFSLLERKSAAKYHLFILVNVFLWTLLYGTAFQQLNKFLHQSATDIPRTIGISIPMKATFFITYIMVDGWAGVAAEVIRILPLILFHLKNAFLVKTEKDREEAMDPGFLDFATYEPRIQLYFLLGLVYSTVTPLLLPFIIVFFAFAYLVFRHQIINVYDRKYETAAAFWPDVNRRIIVGLIISQLLLLGLMSTKGLAQSTPVLLALPVLTIWFHIVCKGRFESAFKKYPLQNAMARDTLEQALEPQLNLRTYLQDAYVHPVFKAGEIEWIRPLDVEEDAPLVATKRSQRTSRVTSVASADMV